MMTSTNSICFDSGFEVQKHKQNQHYKFILTLDGHYQAAVFIIFFAGKKIVSSEVLSMDKALT